MALDTYANLKTAIASFADVNASDLSSTIDDIVRLAEERIWRECRAREMEASISATISVSTVAIPTGYLDLKHVYYVDATGYGYTLRRSTPAAMRAAYPEGLATGRPQYIGTELTTFIFKPTPDVTTYVLRGVMWQKTTPVSTSANPLFVARPALYLYASLCEVERILKRPDQLQLWEQRYREEVRRVNRENSAGDGYAMAHYL